MAVFKEEVRHARERRRCLRFLQKGPAWQQRGAKGGCVLLDGGERGTVSVSLAVLGALEKDDLLRRTEGKVALSAAGVACARRLAARRDPFRGQHWEIERRVLRQGSEKEIVSATLSESPLAQLARRRTRNGEPFLTRAEFDAGEKLRADYTRGQIMPRLSANWIATVSAGKRGAGAGGGVELTDAALAARQRVDCALDAVGPELSGVLVDICCFLKGFEQVETERGWPVRSAKVVLKTALGALARHYEPSAGVRGDKSRPILHWGVENYRPKLA
ncbi:hypothetical protein KUG85_10365 [Nitratireductor sp. L1-7-SE]|uniref:DUF6456 domain-containing protein n=1 Tax=Nitratireductor rhodophyticola TaxID=2854036 RepID=A0ABS7RAY7_9HYPH|nr:DUF6456 domain-containing protein [Nitratireductor rhodophyticola]MBY8918088.1 hypothetical protein [Nitratireductor rhodophyticola]MBY8921103.1 hypothetical protein [Nitratireductor rhodophyticola]